MNVPSVAGRFVSYSSPVPTITADITAEQNRYGTLAELLLDARLTEVEGDVPTRYNEANNSGTTIDRVLTNIPTWFFQSQICILLFNNPQKNST